MYKQQLDMLTNLQKYERLANRDTLFSLSKRQLSNLFTVANSHRQPIDKTKLLRHSFFREKYLLCYVDFRQL